MKIYAFEYAKIGEKEYPLIPITLRHGDQELTTLALVDSGATISVFRSEIADAFDVDWRRGEEMLLQSANEVRGLLVRDQSENRGHEVNP